MAAEYEVNIKLNAKEIETQLGQIDRKIAGIGKTKGGKKQPILALPDSTMLNAAAKGLKELDNYNRKIHLRQREINKQTRDQALSIDTLVKTQEKHARLLNKINEMEAKGLNVSKLRKQLAKATTEQSNRRFGSAEKEFRVLEKSIRLEQSKLRILKEQRKGFPSSPIQGTATMAGSPKQIAEFNKQAAINQRRAERDDRRTEADRRKAARVRLEEQRAFQGRLRAGVGPESVFGPLRQLGRASMIAGADEAKLLAGRFRAPSSPLTARPVTRASADQAAKQVEQEVRRRTALDKRAADQAAAYRRRVNRQVSRAKLDLDQIEFKNQINDIEKLAQRQIKESEKAGRAFDRELKRREKARKDAETARIKNRNRRIGDAALGAGFPLLFGGGPGSVVGGALGGALGGGLAAQIGLSAIGQQIDTFVAGVVDAGKALTSVGGAADFMAEKSLFSSDAMQFRIEKLIEEGNVTEAAALMTQEMAKQVGGSGLKALKDLGTEASKMGKLFGTVMLRIQAFMAQALTPLIKLINSAIGGMVAQNQLDQMLAEAGSPERRAAILARSIELRGTKKQGNTLTRGDFTMQMLQTLQSEYAPVIPEGAAIEPTRLEVLRAAGSGADKAAKLAERQQLEAFLALNKQMTAELDRQDEINFMNGKYIAEQLNMADQINDSQEKRAGLLNAQINGTEEEFRLNQAIKEIKEKGLLPADEERLISAERQIFALQQQYKQVEKQKQLYEQIGQTIKSGLVDGIMSALDGTKSLSESLSGVLRQLASLFLNTGVSQFGQALKIPGFANGGRPPVGRPSIVGERGPELFIPDRSGTIVPNHAMGGANVTVNVDASGSSVEGSADQASQLGKAIGIAVQQELVKQKRPGGLLAR